MDVREKLVELMKEVKYSVFPNSTDHYTFGIQHSDHIFRQVADHLIANCVTVQECGHWEDDHGDYVCSCCRTVFTDDLVWLVRGESNEPNYCPNCGAKMIPQPPKGE